MRLSQQGLLDTAWEPADEPGRPPRHTYRLTADGAALARERLATAKAAKAAKPVDTASTTAGPPIAGPSGTRRPVARPAFGGRS